MTADVRVTVVRTGGFAGLRREWAASGTPDEWLPLVDACPWPSVLGDSTSRDRFVYVISVTAARTKRSATVPEASLTGPWKALVDRVRSSADPAGH